MSWIDPLLYGFFCFAAAACLLAVWRQILLRWNFVDRPGTRSSHMAAIPTGGGVAIVAVVVAAWLLQEAREFQALPLMATAICLCLPSWLDDVRPLPPVLRLCLHVAAVGIGLWLLWSSFANAADDVPRLNWAWIILGAAAWTWFINLFNFMDGIDGMAGVETLTISIGIAVTSVLTEQPEGVLLPAASIAGAAAGFLVWNWHPARLFLGDAGSIPLGFLLGWLLLTLALRGAWPAALILPLYYLADATLTLLQRIRQGAAPWRAHREHLYQRAARNGLNHSQIVLRVALCNAALIAAAIVSIDRPSIGLILAVAAVAILMLNLKQHTGAAGQDAATS